jgi:colicin import membrane protein
MTTEIIELTNLVPANFDSREKFFLNENNEITPLITEISNYYKNLAFDGMDGSTADGRKAIKKVAAELNNKIKEIDEIGKSVVDVLKAKPKRIDAGRKLIRDTLTAVYEEIRSPVVKYEAEQARIKAEEQAKADAIKQAEQEELERLRAEKAQQEREAQLMAQAAENARREAENKAKEIELALKREREENERRERERLAEIQRQKDDELRRLADVEHRRNIKNAIYHSFTNFGIDSQSAKDVIDLIDANKIPNLSINY